MGGVQAHGLDHAGRRGLQVVPVVRAELPLRGQLGKLVQHLFDLLPGERGAKKRPQRLARERFPLFDRLVGQIVQRVHRAAAYVQCHPPPTGGERVNHACSLLRAQAWFATVQLVLQADWQLAWHSPQPP